MTSNRKVRLLSSVVPVSEPSVNIDIQPISTVKPSKISWLWKDKIAFGKITLFAGEPGVGKSQLLLYIASVVSRGGTFHFDNHRCEPGNVLLISGEDSADDTIAPRLMALGADLERIHFVKGIKKTDKKGHEYFDPICLVDHLAELEDEIVKNKYRLVIVDPISLYLGSVDENKNKEIRSALAVLNALAERNNFALVPNSHFSKPSGSSSKNAIYRVMGSIGFAAAARIVFGVMKDPEDPKRRLFIPIKNNIGPDHEGLAYQIKPMMVGGDERIETSMVEWLNEKVTKTANELMNTAVDSKPAPKLHEAKEFLLGILRNGSVPLSEIRSKADAQGITAPRLYEAKNVLEIFEDSSISYKRGKYWSLPS